MTDTCVKGKFSGVIEGIGELDDIISDAKTAGPNADGLDPGVLIRFDDGGFALLSCNEEEAKAFARKFRQRATVTIEAGGT